MSESLPDPSPFARAKVKLVLHRPFYSVLVLHLPTVAIAPAFLLAAGGPATAGVDGRTIYYDQDWVTTLTEEERIGLLAHEALHCAFLHLFRRGHRLKRLWAESCDYAVNMLLLADGFVLPPGGLVEARFSGMSAEQIYCVLLREEHNGPRTRKQAQSVIDVHIESSLGAQAQAPGGEPMPTVAGGGGVEIDRDHLETDWLRRLAQASIVARTAGRLPAHLDRLVQDLTCPKVPWRHLLAGFLAEMVRDDYDLSLPDRRLLQRGIYLPDLRSVRCTAGVVLDTSGSIDETTLRSFASEAAAILHTAEISNIRLLACDAQVTMDETLRPGDPLPAAFPGGGGTDFRPAFERLMHEPGEARPAVIVFMTDLAGTFPDPPPPVPTLWVVPMDDAPTGAQPAPPFGVVIPYDPDE